MTCKGVSACLDPDNTWFIYMHALDYLAVITLSYHVGVALLWLMIIIYRVLFNFRLLGLNLPYL